MAFQITAPTLNVNVSAASQAIALNDKGSSGKFDVRVTNDGTATAWFRFGNSTITTTTTNGTPVRSGATLDYTVQPEDTHAAVIAAGATGRLYFTMGKEF